MEKEQYSRRQRYTIQVLQDTLIDLLQEKPLEKITITELCEQADVNRTTFYRYYVDLNELMNSTLEGLFDQIFQLLEFDPSDYRGSARSQILRALNVTVKKRKAFHVRLSGANASIATKALEDHLGLIRQTILSTGCTEDDADLYYGYFCGGLANLWVRWIESGCSTPKNKVAIVIEDMINSFYTTLENGTILLKG